MIIPDRAFCETLLEQYVVPEHIRDHSRQVCRVALVLLDHWASTANGIDRKLVQAASMLHDITKARSFDTGEDHANTGEVLLAGIGYPEVGYIVGRHVVLDDYSAEHPVGAAEIVNYADKRVLHDRIVPLADRMAYILERYGGSPARCDRIRLLTHASEELEQRIFSLLSIAPPDLEALVSGKDATLIS